MLVDYPLFLQGNPDQEPANDLLAHRGHQVDEGAPIAGDVDWNIQPQGDALQVVDQIHTLQSCSGGSIYSSVIARYSVAICSRIRKLSESEELSKVTVGSKTHQSSLRANQCL